MQWLSRNKPLVKHVLILMSSITLGGIIYVLLAQLSGLLTIHEFEPHPISQISFLLLKICLPWLLLSPLVTIIALRIPLSPVKWASPALIHLGLFLLVSLAHGIAISYSYHYLEDMSPGMRGYQPWQHAGHFLFGDSLFLIDIIVYTIFISSFNLKNFYAIAQQKELDSVRLNQQLTQAKLETLQMQVNPHFLFNTLNVISVLVLKNDSEKAGQMIERLSNFFRQSLNDNHQMMVTLKHELETIQNYLAIEQVRFGEKLSIEINCDKKLESIKVPNMILQPLVENAMNHGIGQIEGLGKLTIDCNQIKDRLTLRVEDNGAGFDYKQNKQSSGIGLTNVKARLQQIYGDDHQFEINGRAGEGVCVTLTLPLQKAERT
ncbi:sensor histidine kinase [Aliikangiella sp. G2MR2-5]|uniref:sensor histidine kinase n=1 Tax=Aliikangiella sp. G2MR2-5 TaxID=2788943 RepID=UPI0018AA3F3D|nr:histidine kinase [Aliikangiella sp. G2MR2-5]